MKSKNGPGLKLMSLLRRRRISLQQFINEFGITTYEGLHLRCERMGVVTPTRQEFEEIAPPIVNSPSEGVLVLDAPPVVKETSGKQINPDNGEEVILPSQPIQVTVITDPEEFEALLPNPTGEHVGLLDGTRKSRKKKSDNT